MSELVCARVYNNLSKGRPSVQLIINHPVCRGDTVFTMTSDRIYIHKPTLDYRGRTLKFTRNSAKSSWYRITITGDKEIEAGYYGLDEELTTDDMVVLDISKQIPQPENVGYTLKNK